MDNAGTGFGSWVEPGEQSTVVHVTGEIDLGTLQDFDEAVRAGLDTPSLVVILNLDKVTFMGSVGLRVLLQTHHETLAAGRTLRVVDGSAVVHRIMEVTQLDQVLSVYPTLAAAQSS
jgi:anti-sigma B factor antagonist